MEDEICPYATFHLLGFREEMDPTKAMNFQTFPHQNGMGGPGHMGTMGSNMAMQVPNHVHSRSGSQSMVQYKARPPNLFLYHPPLQKTKSSHRNAQSLRKKRKSAPLPLWYHV